MSRPNHGRDKHRPPWPDLFPAAYADVVGALADQPLLRISESDGLIVIRGRFQVHADEGVIDTFRIRILFPRNYPRGLPILFETGGRIPAIPDRHVNPGNGSACLYVPEEWLFRRRDDSFSTFLSVPVRNYFLGQLYYETHGRFPPTGEREHYGVGLIAAYADILGTKQDLKTLHYWLRILSAKASKGHWLCPCGSNDIIRNCCRQEVQDKRDAIDRKLAKQMLREVEAEMVRRKLRGSSA